MKLKNFIKENREEIDKCIKSVAPNSRINNDERRLWVLNDEGLYCWARQEGVKI
jgi:hypothetical protein